jgi:CHAT domain-containing protein
VVVLSAVLAQAAAPPRLSPAQKEKLTQRDRWLQRADKHYGAGEIAEAIAALKKGLALERAVFGHVRATSLPWLAAQARLQEGREEFREAEEARRELLRRKEELYGRRDWRATDARLDLDYTRLLARLNVKQRQRLRQAGQWNEQVFQLWQGGRSREALPLARKALAVWREVLGEKHRNTAMGWLNLAAQHQALGRWAEAERGYRQARDIRKAMLGETHPLYGNSLNNLAGLYQAMGDYKAALPLYQQARDFHKAGLGVKHPTYAGSLNNLAALYRAMKEYQAALPLFKQVLDIYEATLGEKHPTYAGSLNNLAGLYQAMGDYKAALPLFQQVLDIRKATLGTKHRDYATSLSGLAMLYQQRGDVARARPLFEQAVDIEQDHLDATFSALSERQRLDLLARSRDRLDAYLSLPPQSASASADYKRVLAWKAAVLARQAEDRLLRDHPRLAKRLGELRTVRAGLAKLTSQPPTPAGQKQWLERFRVLEAQKEKLEVGLASDSAEFRRLRQVEPAAVAAALPEGSALVDLLVYRHRRPDPDRKGKLLSEERLVAFVLVKGGKVQRLDLGAASRIHKAVLAWRKPLQSRPVGSLDRDAAAVLRERLWLPIEKVLGKNRTVLIAPDAILCGLPFAALPGERPGSFLVERYTIGYLTSGRHLLELAGRPGSASGEGLLAVGALDYGTPPARQPGRGRLDLGVGVCRQLPGTRLEIDRIGRLYRDRFPKGRPVATLTGNAADKTALIQQLTPEKDRKAWRYLHLATHAFFLPVPPVPSRLAGDELSFAQQRDQLTVERNPLLRTGLVLSGANRSHETGLCRGEEVAELDLRGTEVVVLSACDSALGIIRGGEGMLGLQRAFQLTGARSLVASLWKVSDSATSVLMEEFYRQLWVEKRTPLEALRQAQLVVLRNPGRVAKREKELVEKRKTELVGSRSRDPADDAAPLPKLAQKRSPAALWAAFVLSGDCR